MILPIDASTAPIKPKYIDEETLLLARWIEFGAGCISEGFSGVDVFVNCSPEQVERLLKARDEFCNEVLDILNGGS